MSEAALPAGNEPILLAFSGGLDTSFLVPWLSATYNRPIITVTVDTGGIDAQAAKVLEQRARELGAQDHILVAAKQAYFDQVIKFLIMNGAAAEHVREAVPVLASYCDAMGIRMFAEEIGRAHV